MANVPPTSHQVLQVYTCKEMQKLHSYNNITGLQPHREIFNIGIWSLDDMVLLTSSPLHLKDNRGQFKQMISHPKKQWRNSKHRSDCSTYFVEPRLRWHKFISDSVHLQQVSGESKKFGIPCVWCFLFVVGGWTLATSFVASLKSFGMVDRRDDAEDWGTKER